MPKKKADTPEMSPVEVIDDIFKSPAQKVWDDLDAISVPNDDAENWAKRQMLIQSAERISEKFTEELGTSDQYDVSYSELEDLDNGFNPKSVVVLAKVAAASESLFHNTWETLNQLKLDLDEGCFVLDRLIEHIERECVFRYRIVDGRIEPVIAPFVMLNHSLSSGVFEVHPSAITEALAKLKGLRSRFIIKHVRKQIEPLDLADRLMDVKERIDHALWYPDYYKSALEILKLDLEKDIERAKERKEIRAAITPADISIDGVSVKEGLRKSFKKDSSTPGFYTMDQIAELEFAKKKKRIKPQTKRGLSSNRQKQPTVKRHPDFTIDRAILLINAIGGSRLLSADKTKLAEVFVFLTGEVFESVRKRYSALNPDTEKYKGNTERGTRTLTQDLGVVKTYLDLLGLPEEAKRLSDRMGIPLTK